MANSLPIFPTNFQLFFEKAAVIMGESVAENFVTGGRPTKWEELKSGGPSHLIRSGALLGSMRQEIGDSYALVGMGRGLPYARIHDEGGPMKSRSGKTWYMPKRQYMMFQKEDVSKLTELFRGYVVEFMKNNRQIIPE